MDKSSSNQQEHNNLYAHYYLTDHAVDKEHAKTLDIKFNKQKNRHLNAP